MSMESQKFRRNGIRALVLSASIIILWKILARQPSQDATGPPSPPPFSTPAMSATQLYNQELVPVLDKSKKQNSESADKAIERLHQDFERYRAGIPTFVDDVASWGTRFGLLGRMTKDRWRNFRKKESDPTSEAVKAYLLEKFEADIMSRDALQKSVESMLSQFKDDVTANRNLMLQEMKLAITTHDMKPEFPVPDFNAFQREFDAYIAGKVQAQGADSIVSGVWAFIASTGGTMAAQQLCGQILELVAGEAAAGAAAQAAVGTGAMAEGAVVGGAGGWLGGPGGAAIGFGAGVAVGVIIDWWVSKNFKSHLTEELTTYLNKLEHDMIEGTKEKPKSGLRSMLHAGADHLYVVQSEAVLKTLEKAK